MARYRSRRSSRRSASQSAANLLALALPAPIQRVADTRLGPLLMLVGVPSMLVAGLLQINWNNGLPSVAVDPQATANVFNNLEQNLEQQGGLTHMASDLFNGVSHSSHEYNYGQGYPTTQQSAPTRVPTANFPSTQPQTAATQRDSRYTTTQPTVPWGQSNATWGQQSTSSQQPSYTQPNYSQQNYAQSQNYSHQPTYAQQPTYSQPTYSQPNYSQPAYSQSGYQQHAASPSDARNLTQQQLYQQQQYQQQQYQYQQQQQQLNEQYRQFQASQQPAANRYQPQYDSYGRPVSTQPTSSYMQPTTQYGQQNYNQGSLPSANTNGRY